MEAKSQIFNDTKILGGATQELFECPSCLKKLQIKEVASHCELEIESLRQMQAKANKATVATENRKPNNIFRRVQKNRETRIRQRTRKRATPPVPAEIVSTVQCPICNKSFHPNEIHRHAEKCLRRSNSVSNGIDEHPSNEEDDANDGVYEEYEEYEWAGQKRIRASSFLEGGYASIGIGQSISHRNREDDDDEDLNVDEDDTQIYGPTQYDEADVIPTKAFRNCNNTETDSHEDEVTTYMRSLITGSVKSSVAIRETQEPSSDNDANHSNGDDFNCQPCSSTAVLATSSASTLSSEQIINSLKTKLHHYENYIAPKYKCLICLDDYRKPAISVACWHVHCEECWLRSLGTRKLCPQCNLITSPKDLRRIYL